MKRKWVSLLLLAACCNPLLWLSTESYAASAVNTSLKAEIARRDQKVVVKFKKIDGKLYYRLQDADTGEWLTDWILVK